MVRNSKEYAAIVQPGIMIHNILIYNRLCLFRQIDNPTRLDSVCAADVPFWHRGVSRPIQAANLATEPIVTLPGRSPGPRAAPSRGGQYDAAAKFGLGDNDTSTIVPRSTRPVA